MDYFHTALAYFEDKIGKKNFFIREWKPEINVPRAVISTLPLSPKRKPTKNHHFPPRNLKSPEEWQAKPLSPEHRRLQEEKQRIRRDLQEKLREQQGLPTIPPTPSPTPRNRFSSPFSTNPGLKTPPPTVDFAMTTWEEGDEHNSLSKSAPGSPHRPKPRRARLYTPPEPAEDKEPRTPLSPVPVSLFQKLNNSAIRRSRSLPTPEQTRKKPATDETTKARLRLRALVINSSRPSSILPSLPPPTSKPLKRSVSC